MATEWLVHLFSIDNLLAAGGPAMWLIAGNCVLLFGLQADRMWALAVYRRRRAVHVETVRAGTLSVSPSARYHRQRAALSRLSLELRRGLPIARALVKIAPLLGLLGTVTGMIAVFDTLAVTGTGDARSLAQGISRATLPTLTGMFVALPALFVQGRLEGQANAEVAWLEQHALTGELGARVG
ncbi:MAG: MotA/TolQ/ExbB proton channel family protein [Pseudomonadota bacterium]